MNLDDLFRADEAEAAGPSRGRMAAQTFAVAVVAGVLGLVLLALLLYGLTVGAVALWSYWWADFA